MNSKLKRPLLAAGIVVGVCALVWGGLTLLRNGSRSAVKVYPVTEIGMTEYGGDTTETSGTVTMDKLQKVYLSKTQSSAQVYVTEGQTVKKGDRLLSYDSTLTELDVERARIALERLRLQQENTRKELQQLQLAEDKEKLQQQADALSAKIEKKLADSTGEIIRRDSKPIQPGKPLLRGSAAGTAEDPLYCDWNSGDALTEQNLSVLLPEGEKELYVVLVTHRGDETLGDIIGSWGLHLIRGENGAISVSLAELPAAEDISVDGTTDEIFYQPGHEYTKGLINSIPKLNTAEHERLVPIEGTPVDLLNPPAGCPFAPRCKNCMKICLSKMPPRTELSDTHYTYCWLQQKAAFEKGEKAE